jgi:predicted deacylase
VGSLHRQLMDQGPLERVLGRIRGREPGPLLLAVGGIHGNEPAGVLALRRVLATLEREALPLRGDFVALGGNLGALRRNERYLQRDLNRGWSATPNGNGRGPEDAEQRQLGAAITSARREARGPVYFLDLHSTSAPGIPFAMANNLGPQRDFAMNFPLPVIMGLLEMVDSTLLEHMRHAGCVTLGIEAGQNDAATSVDHHEAVLWIALASAGLVPPGLVPRLTAQRALLAAARGELPHLIEVEERHAIAPEDGFEMLDGFANIHTVSSGELLARDRNGPIHAPRSCIVLLPLYQAQGDDGFFLGRAVASS